MARTRPRRVRTDAPTCKIGRVAGHDIAALGIWVQACKVPQICCDRRDMPGLRSLHRRVQLRYGAGAISSARHGPRCPLSCQRRE